VGIYDGYTTFDDPIPFWSHSIRLEDRNDENGLMFYPIGIKNYYKFYTYADCLLTDHTYEPDPKILSMSTFEYLYYCNSKSNQKPYILFFDRLLALTLLDEDFPEELKDEYIGKHYGVSGETEKPVFIIKDIVYDNEDFENIKVLIAEQNDLELPDVTKSRDYRDAVKLARIRKRRISGNEKMIGLEEQLICLSLGYGLPYKEIKDVSLRKFSKMISLMDRKMHYEIYMNASMSGMVTFKEKIKHWMTAENGGDDDVVMDRDDVDKIIGGKS
jgi:hypothetical protein